jgi:hypothetical protein
VSRLYTSKAVDAMLKRHAVALATQYADAIETLLPPPCKHRDGREPASCVKCAERRTIQAAAAMVRETGGVQ